MTEKNLPNKRVNLNEQNTLVNEGGGSTKFFGEFNNEVQDYIMDEFISLDNYYSNFFEENKNLPAPSKVVMKTEAIAKSHKPSNLLKDLPIIGGHDLNEIIIRLTKEGLSKTIKRIEDANSDEIKANMTAIESLEPITTEDIISKSAIEELNDIGSDQEITLKVKLFDYKSSFHNEQIMKYVVNQLTNFSFVEKFEFHNVSESLKIFEVTIKSKDNIKDLASIIGIQSVDTFNRYFAIENNEVNFNNVDMDKIYEEKNELSDVTIGIIDSGISPNNIYLEEYVIERCERYLPEIYRNYKHGTFVASMIQYGNQLNRIESDNNIRFSFLDVPVLPNTDISHGEIGDPIRELEFMEIIEDVLAEYSGKVKIWNMSLGTNKIIADDQISDLAVFLDDMQKFYDVQIVLACGNYNDRNIINRTWPISDEMTEYKYDRITTPADSVRALSVGSIASKESDDSIVKINEPSPFSRKGPGPNYIVKPELVDYGGNLSSSYSSHNLGVVGLGVNGEIIENIGTSFSAPRVTRKFAVIYDQLIEKDLLLTKALLIHSARLNDAFVSDDNNTMKYYGFGIPSENSNDILNSSESEITLIFKQDIQQSSHLELLDFPYPESLIDNEKYFGEIFMTVAYNPILDKNYHKEYCRTNIEVSFGVYDNDGEYKGQVPIDRTWEEKDETSLVANGFKWAPIKSYYRNIPRGIEKKAGWKLRVDLTPRLGLSNTSQEFVLIITIKDSKNENDIYSEIIQGLEQRGYLINDIQTRAQIQERNQ